MYNQGIQPAGRRVSSTALGRNRRRTAARSQEQVRLVQLAVCLALFLTIFLWKGIFPQKLAQLREDIQALISSDVDFEKVFAGLGRSLAGGDTVLSDFGDFCKEVFGATSQEEPAQVSDFIPPQPSGVLEEEVQFLNTVTTQAAKTAHYADFSSFGLELETELPSVPEAEPPVEETVQPEESEPAAVPAAGTVVVFSDYSGDPLPSNYTMDQISFGDLETMTPVLGHLNSIYGYRDHPINGQYIFHGGVDIGGQLGDPIAAFASGTVEYTGENDSYGLYLQLDHGNGVRSFYAHCSKIEVTKGQAVSMGDTIARVGSTGTSTGPHLHLELKYNKMHVDPAYYVDFLEP
ncbi:M23 family peptidase [Pseudoflavonifractor sp. 60]|uniref:M23 family metallopeptidase n=1 Tax=Pseudoflavonifractor sp. 60 TaxID=2304576 RepID=UPI001369B623|nr:M23 family metallopeptidase [Pseudoflavonifractor sp. 60]NBI68038.1 M23 family peptidase [Pseudoflavonifractor sp. 60]